MLHFIHSHPTLIEDMKEVIPYNTPIRGEV